MSATTPDSTRLLQYLFELQKMHIYMEMHYTFTATYTRRAQMIHFAVKKKLINLVQHLLSTKVVYK